MRRAARHRALALAAALLAGGTLAARAFPQDAEAPAQDPYAFFSGQLPPERRNDLLTPARTAELKARFQRSAKELKACVARSWLPTPYDALAEDQSKSGFLKALGDPYNLHEGDLFLWELDKGWRKLARLAPEEIADRPRLENVLPLAGSNPLPDNLQKLLQEWRSHMNALMEAYEKAADKLRGAQDPYAFFSEFLEPKDRKDLLTADKARDLKTRYRASVQELLACVSGPGDIPPAFRALGEDKPGLAYANAMDNPFELHDGDVLWWNLEREWSELYDLDKSRITNSHRFWDVLHAVRTHAIPDNLQHLVMEWRVHMMRLLDAYQKVADKARGVKPPVVVPPKAAAAEAERLEQVRTEIRLLRAGKGGLDEMFGALGRLDTAARFLKRAEARQMAPEIAELLDTGNPFVTNYVFRLLREWNVKSTIPAIRARLKSEDLDDRKEAARALGVMNAKEAVADLDALLSDEYDSVRVEAAVALARLGEVRPDAAIEKAMTISWEDDEGGVHSAVSSLFHVVHAYWGRKEAVPELAKLLKGHGHDTRNRAALALAQLGAWDEAAPALREALGEDEAWEDFMEQNTDRIDIALLFAQEGIKGVESTVQWLLGHPNNAYCLRAAIYTSRLAMKDAVPALLELLKDSDRYVRATAAVSLVELGAVDQMPDSAAADLEAAASLKAPDFAERARKALETWKSARKPAPEK